MNHSDLPCIYRIVTGGCKLEVCPDNEICDIKTAEPNCADYEPVPVIQSAEESND